MTDCYRLLYPEGRDMTYISTLPHMPSARLDRFYTRSAHADDVHSHRIFPSNSDHCFVELSMHAKHSAPSPLWKLDNDLLNSEIFVFQIKNMLSAFTTLPNKGLHDYEKLKRQIKYCAIATKAYLHRERLEIIHEYQRALQEGVSLQTAHNNHLLMDIEYP